MLKLKPRNVVLLIIKRSVEPKYNSAKLRYRAIDIDIMNDTERLYEKRQQRRAFALAISTCLAVGL
eukprot:1126790-Prorocentrum_minimum.AAC.3